MRLQKRMSEGERKRERGKEREREREIKGRLRFYFIHRNPETGSDRIRGAGLGTPT